MPHGMETPSEILPGLWLAGSRWRFAPDQQFDLLVTVCEQREVRHTPAHSDEIRLAMADRTTRGASRGDILDLAATVARRVAAGESVVVRCQWGVERSAMIVALAMRMLSNETFREVLTRMRRARSEHVLFNPASSAWTIASGSLTAPPVPKGGHVNTDGWTRCDLGHEHWGRAGAAGALIMHTDAVGVTRYLMQHRSRHVQHGSTWGIPGGALRYKESPLVGAMRETLEELGDVLDDLDDIDTFTDEHGGWAFHSVIFEASSVFPTTTNWETGRGGTKWLTADEIDALHLHPGFEATWPRLEELCVSAYAEFTSRRAAQGGVYAHA